MKSAIPNSKPTFLSNWRRPILGALALSLIAAPALGSGCAASFDPPTQIQTLRILAVTPDKPYPAPGDTVNFQMTLQDGYTEGETGNRPIQIVWLGGCFNPPADQYFLCYEQLAKVFGALAGGPPSPEVLQYIGIGNEFNLKIPADIVSSRPPPTAGPHYGLAYVFFAACAGQIKPVLPEGKGAAPDFPLGCFDENGKQLGAESFVPGYTQVYSFADERENQNPIIGGMTLNDKPMSDAEEEIPLVEACPVTEDERREAGCNAKDTTACKTYTIKLQLEPSVAEIDPDGKGKEGEALTEAVWVSYFTDRGNIGPGIKLVNDPVEGFNPDLATSYLPPDTAGFATIWAVVRDARGGSAVLRRYVNVQPSVP